MLPSAFNDLPTKLRRAALTCRNRALAYLVFQLPGFAKIPVARKDRALLPHGFTLTPCGAVYFLWHFPSLGYSFLNAFPLGSEMHCVARTFLPDKHRGDRTAYIFDAKIRLNCIKESATRLKSVAGRYKKTEWY